MFAGHIKVPDGPHMARVPGVAQAWIIIKEWGGKICLKNWNIFSKNRKLLFFCNLMMRDETISRPIENEFLFNFLTFCLKKKLFAIFVFSLFPISSGLTPSFPRRDVATWFQILLQKPLQTNSLNILQMSKVVWLTIFFFCKMKFSKVYFYLLLPEYPLIST